MGVGNIPLLFQVTIYIVAFLVSFFILIPLSVYMAQWNNHCLLFVDGHWTRQNDTDIDELIVEWQGPGYCHFPIAAGVFSLIVALVSILWMSVYLFKNIDPTWLASFLAVASCVLCSMLMLVACIILSVGYSSWCKLIGQKFSCEDSQFAYFKLDVDVNKIAFNVEFGMAQFGVWVSLASWVMLVALASHKLYQYHRQEDFFTSMRRERQRLLNRVTSNSSLMV